MHVNFSVTFFVHYVFDFHDGAISQAEEQVIFVEVNTLGHLQSHIAQVDNLFKFEIAPRRSYDSNFGVFAA
jgi:hypothetical protein